VWVGGRCCFELLLDLRVCLISICHMYFFQVSVVLVCYNCLWGIVRRFRFGFELFCSMVCILVLCLLMILVKFCVGSLVYASCGWGGCCGLVVGVVFAEHNSWFYYLHLLGVVLGVGYWLLCYLCLWVVEVFVVLGWFCVCVFLAGGVFFYCGRVLALCY